jgi:Tfp pilus assembly PilM family ATPase
MKWEDLGLTKNSDGTTSRKILFMAIPTEQVMQYVRVARDAGFTVVDVELESISMARALTSNTTEPTLIIDMGGRSSVCTVAKAGKAFCITQTDFSSDSTTTAVAQALSISPARAESLKRQSAISLAAGSHELSTIVAPIIGAILGEAGRAKRLYEELTQEPVTKIIVCGAGSLLNGMEQYVQSDLKQPVTRASTLGGVISYPPELQALLPELNARLTVALGLALSKSKTTF